MGGSSCVFRDDLMRQYSAKIEASAQEFFKAIHSPGEIYAGPLRMDDFFLRLLCLRYAL